MFRRHNTLYAILPVLYFLFLTLKPIHGSENQILGEIRLHGASQIEETSGVWIDGQYLGFVKELKGSKSIFVLPGLHTVAVRQAGYKEYFQKILLEPGQKKIIYVVMEKDPTAQYPDQTAKLKFVVKPNRAAIFLEDHFVGFVDQFDGPGQWLLVAPGLHRIKICLPGYKTFETEIGLNVNQKFELKTALAKGSILQAGPVLLNRDIASAQK